jgi:hypothetical protein
VRSGCALGQTGGGHASKATLVEHGGAGHAVGLMHSHVVPGGGQSHAAAITILSLRDLMSAPAWSGADLLLLKLDIEGGELQVCDPCVLVAVAVAVSLKGISPEVSQVCCCCCQLLVRI